MRWTHANHTSRVGDREHSYHEHEPWQMVWPPLLRYESSADPPVTRLQAGADDACSGFLVGLADEIFVRRGFLTIHRRTISYPAELIIG